MKNGYNWKKVVIDYMIRGPRPLLHGAACGCKSTLSREEVKILIL